jgi:hypothetical protein
MPPATRNVPYQKIPYILTQGGELMCIQFFQIVWGIDFVKCIQPHFAHLPPVRRQKRDQNPEQSPHDHLKGRMPDYFLEVLF